MTGWRAGVLRRRRLASAVLAAVLVAIGLVVALRVWHNGDPVGASARTAPATSPLSGSPSPSAPSAVPALSCPHRYRHVFVGTPDHGWVPSAPEGIDGSRRLVPNKSPGSVVVCGYEYTQRRLLGRTTLGGDLHAVTSDLSAVTRGRRLWPACGTFYDGTARSQLYLVGFRFGTATVWVSASGPQCNGSTNGSFNTVTNLAAAAAQAYQSGRWSNDPQLTSGCDAAGRVPDEIPRRARSLTVCAKQRGTWHLYRFPGADGAFAEGAHTVAREYNTWPRRGSCGRPRTGLPTVVLRFGYSARSDVVVRLTGRCLKSGDHVVVNAKHAAQLIKNTLFILGRRT